MKTQTFGLSIHTTPVIKCHTIIFWVGPAIPPLYVPTLFSGIKTENIDKWSWSEKDKWLAAIQEATQDYKNHRENGDNVDNPARAFPNDGTYKWESVNSRYSIIRYTEGAADAAWMAEKDKNFLSRVVKTRQVAYAVTPFPNELIAMSVDYLTGDDAIKEGGGCEATIW